jgi:hypothetical protein
MKTYGDRKDALRALLSDGQWHDRGELELHMEPYIDAKTAARNYISNYNTVRRKRGMPTDGAERSDENFDEAYRRGRWRIIQNLLSHLGCERQGPRGSPEYRWPQAEQGAPLALRDSEDDERPERTLAELEGIVQRGEQAFWEVGQALAEINRRTLYRPLGHPTFEDYLEKRWRWGLRNGYHYIQAARVRENLQTFANPPPAFGQCTVLATLKPEAQRALAQTVDFSKITVRDLKERVRNQKRTPTAPGTLTLVEAPSAQPEAPRVSVVATAEGFAQAIRHHLEPGQIADLLRLLSQEASA